MTAYTKERLLAVAFLFLFIATGHPWIWTFILGARNNQRVFGFPAHYFLSLVLFFVGITLTSVAWVFLEGRVAEEISESGEESEPRPDSQDTRATSQESQESEVTSDAESDAEQGAEAERSETTEEAGA